ncbi:prepilin-type N-terminal cleavage/methylation domain-containing protein [bacterium]|nr:MAG: prepilin-type N-terminal cleavage/methylation domain-containing protein [bacterium]
MKKRFIIGFTLVEVLISTIIFSVIIVSLYSALNTGALTYKMVDEASNLYQVARLTLEKIGQDLKNCVVYKDDESAFSGQSKSLSFFTIAGRFKEGRLEDEFCFVEYSFEDEVFRRTSSCGKDALLERPDKNEDTISYPVHDGYFEYAYPLKDREKPYEWRNLWPAEEKYKNTLPLAVSIQISLIEDSDRKKENLIDFSRIVSLPLGGDF